MSYAVHIHPCQNARQRDTAVRIAERVAQAKANDADDLVDDILFILDKSGLDEARMSAADDVRQVSIEGRLWLSWFPAELAKTLRAPSDDTDGEYPIPAAAMRFGYNEKTLRIYVAKGWLRAGTNERGHPVITDSAMRAFTASLCKGTNGANVAKARGTYGKRGFGAVRVERRRSLVERLRRKVVRKVVKRSCTSPPPPLPGRGVSEHLRNRYGTFGLRPVRSGYPLKELVPLLLRRELVVSRDSATYPLAGNSGPPSRHSLQRAGP